MDIALANTAANKAVKVAVNTNAWDAIWGASPIVQLTLLTLVGMSVVAWSIIFGKRKQLRNLRNANEKFLYHFWEATSLDSIYGELNRFEESSVARVFKVGYVEMQKIADSDLANKGEQATKLSGLDNVHRALRKATDNELSLLDSKLSFLATTGSTGPFIGLFGTVWGIMSAFQKIGQTGAASLAVVAPGISEALISTAIGLVAAIPAVVAYNTFNSQIKKEELELANFTTDFLNIVKRNFFRD